jgi:hypothetical protein
MTHADFGFIGKRDAGLDAIFECRLRFGIAAAAKPDREFDAGGPAAAAFTGPERRFHPAFGGKVAGQGAGRGGLQQLQRTIEIRLSDAVGADEDGDGIDRKPDALNRAIARDVDLADLHHGHFTIGGIDDRMESTLPPVRSPKIVPRS